MRWLGWLRPAPLTDWQALVDAVELAVAIAWGKSPRRWVAPYRYAARTVADYYYAVILAGNLDVGDVDAELFALDAALSKEPTE